MKLASFKVRGRECFGAVVGEGVVDLKTRLAPKSSSVLDLLRGNGLDTARDVANGVRADFPLSEVEFLPPVTHPEKILCIGINYANRNVDYGDQDVPQYPSMFYRAPGSAVAYDKSIVRPRESEQLNYEGEHALRISPDGPRIAKITAVGHRACVHRCNDGAL